MCTIKDDFHQTAFLDYLKKVHNICVHRHTFAPATKKLLYEFFILFRKVVSQLIY
jgi:hypothetical protein